MLFWLLQRMDDGINVGQAAHQLQLLLKGGHDPQVVIPPYAVGSTVTGLRSPGVLREEIVQALIRLDERAAEHLLREALALYTLQTALITILQLAVREVRELHRNGVIPTSTQYLALNYVHQRLLNIGQMSSVPRNPSKSVITIGFSSERSEIALLILGILLRRHGIPVTYLGTDLEPKMLEHALDQLDHLNARFVVFYADDPKNLMSLIGLEMPRGASGERIRSVCCGRALEIAPELRAHIQCEYLGADLHEVIHIIAQDMLAFTPERVT